MQNIVYSTTSGCYAFDEKFNIIDTLKFEQSDENFEKLGKQEWLDEEIKLLKKHNATFLGSKTQNEEKKHEFKCMMDPLLLEKATASLLKTNILWEIHESNLHATKIAISNSLKPDLLIVQAINNIEELDKVSNTLAKRLREWYELYNPEFSKSIGDHYTFAKLVDTRERKALLKEIGMTEQESMGAEFSDLDIEEMRMLAREIIALKDIKEKHEEYISKLMDGLCPNLKTMVGVLIGAKLIAISGDFKRLSLFPASTVQLLGAEKALFRHIKTGSRAPKYGILMQHPLVNLAKKSDKGKVARALANKITLAIKVDIYGEEKSNKLGKKYLEDLEKKFKQNTSKRK